MNIKITDNRKEMAEIGKKLAMITKADISSEKYVAFWKEMEQIGHFTSEEEKEEFFYAWLYDFWVYGNVMREEFFLDFPNKTHEEKMKYITFSNRFEYYSFLNDEKDEMIFKHKYLTYERFKDYFKRDALLLKDENDYERFCEFTEKHSSFIVKPDNLGLGTGVHIEHLDKWNNDKKKLFDALLSEASGNGQKSYEQKSTMLIEELITQDPVMSKLYPNAVNIMRITTVLFDDRTEIIDAWLRIGINGNEITCASLGEIYCGVNLETGIVETKGYTEFADTYDQHPTTKVDLMGYKIPRWDELMKLSRELSLVVPTVRHVGWDIALTKDGWVLIEGNETGEFLGQMMYQKPYKEYIENMIGFKPREGLWWKNKNPKFV